MSEWAYKECPLCGKRVHINCYCGDDCPGDPWGIETDAMVEITMLEQDRRKYALWMAQIDEKIERVRKRLPKTHDSRTVMTHIKRLHSALKDNFDNRFNTPFERKYIKEHLEVSLAAYNVEVICDESNNPPDVMDDNDLVARVMWKNKRLEQKYVDLHFGKIMHWYEETNKD